MMTLGNLDTQFIWEAIRIMHSENFLTRQSVSNKAQQMLRTLK